MKRRLGFVGKPYEEGVVGRLSKATTALSGAGAALTVLGGRNSWLARAGAALVLAGAACERWTVYKAGFASARDPRYTVAPQRARMAERDGGAATSTQG
jgi:hypothetical protein